MYIVTVLPYCIVPTYDLRLPSRSQHTYFTLVEAQIEGVARDERRSGAEGVAGRERQAGRRERRAAVLVDVGGEEPIALHRQPLLHHLVRARVWALASA